MSAPAPQPRSGQRTGIVEGWELRQVKQKEADSGAWKGFAFVGVIVLFVVVGGWFVGRPYIGQAAASVFEDSPGIISFPIISDLVGAELGDRANVPAGAAGSETEFQIEEGQNLDDIEASLVEQGLINDTLAFKYLVVRDDVDQLIRPGVYTMGSDITPEGVVALLVRGPDPPKPTTVLDMRPARRIEQVAAYLQQQVEAGELDTDVKAFVSLARNPDPGLMRAYNFLRQVPEGNSLEGFLAPGTYEVEVDITADELIATMLERWAEQNGATLAQARKKDVDFYDMMKVASLVDREAKTNSERAKIAGVYWNRLNPRRNNQTGGLLQADPTVVYATDTVALNDAAIKDWDEYVFWDLLGLADYSTVDVPARLDSFQTYRNAGLPDWPIVSPSEASIKAALEPNTKNRLLFFVACPGDDKHKFSKTARDHNRKVAKCRS
jgi:UPF0755 protein